MNLSICTLFVCFTRVSHVPFCLFLLPCLCIGTCHSIPLCIIVGSLFFVMWTCGLLVTPDPVSFPGYEISVLMILFSVLIEMSSEPLFIYAQLKSDFSIRIIAESSALLVRCSVLLGYVMLFSEHGKDVDDERSADENPMPGSRSNESGRHILTAFSTGQVLGSISYSLIFWCHFYRQPDFQVSRFMPSISDVSVTDETKAEDDDKG